MIQEEGIYVSKKQTIPKKLSDIQTIFHLFDRDKDGSISGNDLYETFKIVGMEMTPQQIDTLMSEIRGRATDLNQKEIGITNTLDFTLFSGFIERQLESSPLKDQLKEIFMLLDKDGTGIITPGCLADTCSKLGVALTEHDARQLMVQSDGQAKANYDKFVQLMEITRK
ncbi:EF hand family protein [Cryptosporidium serpentis]